MRTMAGMQKPLGGEVWLDGVNIHELPARELAKKLSVVLTERISVGVMTSHALVALGRYPHTNWAGALSGKDHEVIQWALQTTGALEFGRRQIGELSDGERQKVMVARALAQEPQLMILDEITALLDLPRRVEIMRMLRDPARKTKRAILLSTHDLDLALRSADRIWLLPKNGGMKIGAPEDLVLSGSFETAFASEGVEFDQQTGSFHIAQPEAGTVAIIGEGIGEGKETFTESVLAKEALRKSEERFRIAAELASDLIYEWDIRNRRMEWSGDIAERLGYDQAEFLRTVEAWELALHPSDYDRIMAAIKSHMETGEPLNEEYRIRRKDGEFLYWTDRRRALMNENGASYKWIGVISDITQRKRAEERQLRLQLAVQQSAAEWQLTFDAIQYPVLIIDSDCIITQANRATCEISGVAEGACFGRSIESLGAGQPWKEAAELVRLMCPTHSTMSCITHDEDTGKTWEITASPIPGVKVKAGRIIILARDITQQVLLEASLRRSELMAALGSLVAGVAHEVRNPLFGVSSVLDAFEARFGDRSEYQQYISVLREELGHLNRLMEDLLDYGKPYTQETQAGSIYDVVVGGIIVCESLAEQGQVKIVNNVPKNLLPVVMDVKRLPQVFSNLIKNAIQHSLPGATVDVDAEEIIVDRRPWVECRVKDSGPGFQIEDLSKIFDPFFTRRRGGTGLGLSIVQRIVHEHGGKITACNRSEGGAEVVVRIPVERGS